MKRYFALVALVVLAACTDRVLSPPNQPFSDVVLDSDPVVVAAGDMVCGTGTSSTALCKHAETAALTTGIAPAAALLLGDIQYESGTLSDFNTFYHPTWGVHNAIARPAPGNHEYQTSGAAGYFDYYNGNGVQTGARSQGYYSFNVGTWHIVSLNSNCTAVGGCGAGSAQETWLRADLAANPAACTLAYWHHPRFSSGQHGNNSITQALWQALYDHGADLILAGHDHNYERFGPQTATGVADVRGIRSFVVGTGGKELRSLSTTRANSERRDATSLGVLKLTLHPTSYDWEFVPIPGHTLVDAGSAACVTSEPPPPPTQATLTIDASADAYTLRDSPKANFGSAATLLVDASPEARTYLKFNVTGIGTKSIVSAKLRLHAVDPSDAGGILHRVTSTSWKENTIKWNGQPSYTATALGSLGAVTAGTWYEIDVTSAITLDGVYSFALRSTTTNGADYASRESPTGNRPQLVIVVQ
jgi:hypothetical protein